MRHVFDVTCSVEGCSVVPFATGLCSAHYAYKRRTGRLAKPTREERFWQKVEKTEGCWLWLASGPSYDGYGRFFNGQRVIVAHKFAYELLVGPVPEGLTLDHLCRTRRCVRPDHLEPVTRGENVRRGRNAQREKEVCPRCGNAYDYIQPSSGARHCRRCRNEYMRSYKPRWRAERKARGLAPS